MKQRFVRAYRHGKHIVIKAWRDTTVTVESAEILAEEILELVKEIKKEQENDSSVQPTNEE
jgi:hypothetical protein